MDEFLEKAKQAVQDVFNNTNVPRSETRDALEELIGEIRTYLDALAADERREQRESVEDDRDDADVYTGI